MKTLTKILSIGTGILALGLAGCSENQSNTQTESHTNEIIGLGIYKVGGGKILYVDDQGQVDTGYAGSIKRNLPNNSKPIMIYTKDIDSSIVHLPSNSVFRPSANDGFGFELELNPEKTEQDSELKLNQTTQ